MIREIRSPYDGTLVGRVTLASREEVEAAIGRAVESASQAAALPSHARASALSRVRASLIERKEELARVLAAEAGKPLTLARIELDRTIFVFEQGMEESKRQIGEVLPMDLLPHGEGRWGLTPAAFVCLGAPPSSR